ncbi:MAG: hypothetical protein IJC80_03110 [Clostridia bacterium]|nr:hypothetical protein [Clostridia bacterium]
MRTRKLLCTLIALAMVLGVMPLLALSIGAQETVNVTNGEYSLKLEKSEFKKGEPIFVTATGNSDNDWIGISKAGSSAYIDYHYLGFAGNGIPFDVLQKSTSYAAGEYDIFLVPNNKSYNASTVVAKTTVTITDEAYQGTFEDPKTDIGDTTKLVTKDGQRVFKKGEPIYISATGNSKDWIGFYDDVYDESYSAYRYVSEMGGSGVYYDITSYRTFAPGTHFIRFIQDGSAKPYETYTIAGIYITVTDEQYVAPDEGGDSGEGEAGGTEGGGTEDVEIDTANSVTASNSTHSMTVNKTKFEAGESIWISAQGVGSKDWIGIAQRGYTEGTIRWYYISDAGNGNFYDVKQAPNIGGSLSAYASIPEGLYTLYLIENDGYLKNGFTLSINISVGNVEDTENGKITVTG